MTKNRYLLFCIIVWLAGAGAGEPGPAETVRQFYLASQNGNVTDMRQLIAGTFYNRRKVLLEQNSEYPQFLRSHYLDARITVDRVILDETNAVATVTAGISYPDGNRESHDLVLKQDVSGSWKIVGEQQY